MQKNVSEKYGDYWLKDGKFIGDFEGMYQNSAEIPWQQDRITEKWHRKLGLDFLECAFSEYGKEIKDVLEIGCGYGYLLSAMKRRGIHFHGCDISPTVVKDAIEREKDCHFFVGDIMKWQDGTQYNLVILYETIWYILHEFDSVIKNLKKIANPYLAVSLCFPRKDKEYYGKSILPEPERLTQILEKDFSTCALMQLQKPKDVFPEDGTNFYWLGRNKA